MFMPEGKSLRGLYSFVSERTGGDGLKVLKALGDGATDDVIEQKTNFKVSNIRHLLNVLHENGIVNYTREKNMQTGWFTYTWYFDVDRTTQNLLRAKRRQLAGLKVRLTKEETKDFYQCNKKCRPHGFEEAFDNSFKCLECGCRLKPEKDSHKEKRLNELNEQINSLQQLLGNFESNEL